MSKIMTRHTSDRPLQDIIPEELLQPLHPYCIHALLSLKVQYLSADRNQRGHPVYDQTKQGKDNS